MPSDNARLRVATFNIHNGEGQDGRVDLVRTAACLEGFDLIALHEVDGPAPWGDLDQAAALGRELGMMSLFAPAERRWWRDYLGNGLLSRLDCREWSRVPLAGTQGKGFRNYVVARIDWGGRIVNLLATHVDRKADRQAQLAEIGRQFLELPEPAILLGDLNSTPNDPLMRSLLESPGVGDPVAKFVADPPVDRVEWILVRGLASTAAGMVRNGASDHPCVWAELATR